MKVIFKTSVAFSEGPAPIQGKEIEIDQALAQPFIDAGLAEEIVDEPVATATSKKK